MAITGAMRLLSELVMAAAQQQIVNSAARTARSPVLGKHCAMSSKWSLPELMKGGRTTVWRSISRSPARLLVQSVAKGDGSALVWANLFRKDLPKQYAVDK
jgi:hypothetical protein